MQKFFEHCLILVSNSMRTNTLTREIYTLFEIISAFNFPDEQTQLMDSSFSNSSHIPNLYAVKTSMELLKSPKLILIK